ncbi:MAG: 5-(carboxyamino)imidazole ribonucleotide mutase [Deltaproteobacteria bacterium]|nr:MAG: 5-(carboxyamino)imidazole ribonucleotide mutase [Deltaproteobacteria bacterium]
MNKPRVGIVMGSDSDLPAMEEAAKILKKMKIEYKISICSAHRSPQKAREYAQGAVGKGLEVIIAGAGGAAHLAGVIAAETAIPVIGVPLNTSSLNGLDALLSTVQMPGGVPVAAMAIGKTGARNAALFAAEILGIKYPEIRKRIEKHKKELARGVEEKDRELARKLKISPRKA